jgi:signal transduction histidine kinase
MGASGGGVRAGPDPSLRAEIVHSSERTRITRLFLPGRTVIRKEPLGPDAERRVRHEAAMLERLGGVAGVAQLEQAPRYPGSAVLADAGGASLAGMTRPRPAGELAGLGLGLARAVAGMHERGVIHRDITPANIVVADDGIPCLVDFALASSFAEIRPEFTHHAEITGTLAYLAPEATGRTGRPVDQRADLYALGAVLYELATGEPPFGAGDPLRLLHDHLARVPVPPAEVNPAVPAALSEVIMHLLEKEPDSRYQTADGLIYDLERLREVRADPAAAVFGVGEHDFPVRLLPPSRLAGRDDEVAALEAAFAGALAGECRGVLVAGAPGVGKTALIDQLRPVVTGGDGWFVAGKFDQYRRDLEFDAGYQAFRALGRLLLAEPEDELALLRERIVAAAGPNAVLLAAVLPEFAALLGVAPDAGDPLTAQARVQRATAAAVRAVASRKRPVVLFLDDLQWAGSSPLGFVDLVLSEEPVEGLLLVGAYRQSEVDAAHPLAAPLSRWLGQVTVRHLRLANLPEPGLAAMVAGMLHVDLVTVAGLAGAVEPHTRGNPYETVELLNALRRDGLLTATAAGWRWDETAVAAHLGRSEVGGLLAARAAALPEKSRRLAEAMACLGGRAELSLLQAATGEPADLVDQALAPALEEGVLVAEPGAHPAVRFRHDRIREAVLDRLDTERRRALQLAMARRLAAVPELFAVAAEQYLPVADAVVDAAERRQVAGLLRRAAGQATLTGDHTLVHALLTAALAATDLGETATLAEVHTGRHAALYSLGRLEEADEVYRTIERLRPAVVDRADATAVQLHSVTHRSRYAEALRLGLESLRELGIAVPAADRLAAELDHEFDYWYRWLDHTEAAGDLARPGLTDPVLLSASGLINATQPAAFFLGDPATVTWLGVEALRICLEHGPAPALVVPVAYTGLGAVALRGDYAAGYRAARRILALADARGYEPGASQARMQFAALSFWAEPIENSVHQGQRAREGLIAGGDLTNASYSNYLSVSGLLDCGPLERYLTEVEAALAFSRRTGKTGRVLDSYRWLADVLRDESTAAAGAAVSADKYSGDPVAQFFAHFSHATAAAVFGDLAGLERHTAAAMTLVPMAPGLYPTGVARLLRGLALAAQARDADADTRGGLLAELDELTRWLAERAADAPDNFLHLLRLLEAERAWAAGDFRAAALAFDAARHEAARRQRPWHRALIAEHAARFYLARGLEHAGHDLLAQARQEYLAWGATAKVTQLDWAYPARRPPPDPAATPGEQPGDLTHRRAAVTAGTVDLLGILSASQALSSETSIGALHDRVAGVLSAMTGATAVHLLLWDEDRQDWVLPAPGGGTIPASGTGQEGAAPMSVLRYVQRTSEPLVVGDATGDDRFARDAYFTDITCCSLLAVPILSRGALRAVLLLENRLIRAAFTAERLDAVNLIAGQLAVSLDNAQLYAGYRRIADEQAALRRVATLVARAAPPPEVFAAVAEEVGALLAADYAVLVRYDSPGTLEVVGTWTRTGAPAPTPVGGRLPLGGRNVTTAVWQTARPARIDYDDAISGVIGQAATRDWGVRSSAGVPVSAEGQVWGAIVVALTGSEFLPADTESRLAGFTELLSTAIANAEAQAEVTAARARIVAAADQARRRIERDLHDGTQQRLVSLALKLRAAQAAVPPELARQLDEAVAEATGALEELTEIARGIHPAVLAERGLGPALRTLARRSPVPVDLRISAGERLPEEVEVSAYYVVAEALTNAAKHSGASAVSIEVDVDGEALRVAVRDDGAGGADLAAGTGLAGLKDRVEALGGRILLDSRPGAGTSLQAEFSLIATNGGAISR